MNHRSRRAAAKRVGPSLFLPLYVAWGCACAATEASDPGVPRASAERLPPVVSTVTAGAAAAAVRLIAFNDFHGNLMPLSHDGRPVGGAEVFAAYVRSARVGFAGKSLLVHAGDQVGASPAISALLQDEPAIELLNLLANDSCSLPAHDDPACDVVGTLGNHEFDEGVPELLRLLRGGNSSRGPFIQNPYRGARFPYVSANVVARETSSPILPSYVIRDVGGIPVGVIGAVLGGARQLLNPASPGLASIDFIDEVQTVNRVASELVARGVRVIVLTIHQGLEQTPYRGETQRGVLAGGELSPILRALHEEIDVVVSGHTHSFTNAYVATDAGKELLVVQSLSAGRAISTIDLSVHPTTYEVLDKTAEVTMTYADVAPGNQPQADVAALVAAANSLVAARTSRVVGRANVALPREFNADGESALGNLVADAQRIAAKADMALTNPGGIRTGLPAGPITWGDLFSVQPFGNQLVVITLTGQQLGQLLERQWRVGAEPRFLQVSGFSYDWAPSAPIGRHVTALRRSNGAALAADGHYRVVVNSYMARGGDDSGLEGQASTVLEVSDLEALVRYFEAHPAGIEAPALGRIHQRDP